jgi:predicted ester cyclase
VSTPNKHLVRRLIGDVINGGRLEDLDALCAAGMAREAAGWIGSFREAFPDVRMTIVELLAEGETVVGRFRCSATHLGPWRGHAATGRRFEDVDEVYFFQIADGRISSAWGIEDTLDRLRQLGLPA